MRELKGMVVTNIGHIYLDQETDSFRGRVAASTNDGQTTREFDIESGYFHRMSQIYIGMHMSDLATRMSNVSPA